MSTLQHTLQPAIRNPRVLLAALAAAIATVAVVLIVSAGSSTAITERSGPQVKPSRAELQHQLESVAGPRYGLRGYGVAKPTPPSALYETEAMMDRRFHRPAPAQPSR